MYRTNCRKCGGRLEVVGGKFSGRIPLSDEGFCFSDAKELDTEDVVVMCVACETIVRLEKADPPCFPLIGYDSFGLNPRTQIMVFDQEEEPAVHVRYSADLRRVVEIVVRDGIDVIQDSAGVPVTAWEKERDRDPGFKSKKRGLEGWQPEAGSCWLARVDGCATLIKVLELGRFYRFGSASDYPAEQVEEWLMEICLPPK